MADFEPDADGRKRLRFAEIGADDESLRGAEENAPADEQTHFVLCRLYDESGSEPVALSVLSMERNQSDGTTRNHMTSLKKKGLVVAHGDNTFSPIQQEPEEVHPPSTPPRGVGTVNEIEPAHSLD